MRCRILAWQWIKVTCNAIVRSHINVTAAPSDDTLSLAAKAKKQKSPTWQAEASVVRTKCLSARPRIPRPRLTVLNMLHFDKFMVKLVVKTLLNKDIDVDKYPLCSHWYGAYSIV